MLLKTLVWFLGFGDGMRLGLVVSVVVAVLVASTPVLVSGVSGLVGSVGGVVSEVSVSTVSLVGGGGGVSSSVNASVVGRGCVVSSVGPDKLVVCPAEVYVSGVGAEVKLVATVYFSHVPCKYGRWSLSASAVNASVVKEVGPEVSSDGSRATEVLYVRVLGNGSVTITFKYNCPYGNAEVAKVRLYVVKELPKEVTEVATTSVTNVATQELSREEHERINETLSGEVISKSLSSQYIVLSTKVYVKGEWVCGNETMNWEELLKKVREGDEVKVVAEVKEFGLKAVRIELGNEVCYLSRGGHEESLTVTTTGSEPLNSTQATNSATSVVSSEGSVSKVSGTIEEVGSDYVVVNGVKIYFRGRWSCNESVVSRWDVVGMLSKGEVATIYYETHDWGNKAVKVITGNSTCVLATG